jgi:hypothetical protein
MGQSQIAEILPLSGKDMAAVAVLLVVSDNSDASAGRPIADGSDVRDRIDVLAEVTALIGSASSASPLERFLLDIADPAVGIPVESGGVTSTWTGLGPEWVWREGVATSSTAGAILPSGGMFADAGAGRARRNPPPNTEGSLESASGMAFADLNLDGATDSALDMQSPILSRFAAAVAIVALSTATYVWKRWQRHAAQFQTPRFPSGTSRRRQAPPSSRKSAR